MTPKPPKNQVYKTLNKSCKEVWNEKSEKINEIFKKFKKSKMNPINTKSKLKKHVEMLHINREKNRLMLKLKRLIMTSPKLF